MEENKNEYGSITVGAGSGNAREIPIQDFLRTYFKDNRLISISSVKENEVESYVLVVENPTSTGRAPVQTMWLSEESLTGLLTSIFLYFDQKGIQMNDLCKKAADGEEIKFEFSTNLQK